MLLNGEPSRQGAPRRKDRHMPKKRVIAIASGVVLLAALGSLGFAVGKHQRDSTSNPLAATLTGKPFTPPKSWKLTFDSNFTGSSLNTKVWDTCYPWATSNVGCTNYGNSGDEDLEWYRASQDQVSGGVLHLVARREPTPGLTENGAPKRYACRSGMVTSFPGLKFQYGVIQITAKIPFGPGLWPALWLAATNEKWPPEIDILEHWASDSQGKIYLHPTSGPRQGGPVNMPDLGTGWHTFTLEWTKSRLTWYYDGTQVASATVGIPQQSMYLIANLADDITTPGTCSGSMEIKSVKVWQP
jgi:beta-glucanase (GH16 family)